MPNKTIGNGDRNVAKATHVTSLTEFTCHFGRNIKSKMIHGKVLSIYNKKTKIGHNSQLVHVQFDLRGGSTKIADMSIRSTQTDDCNEGKNTVGGGDIKERAPEYNRNGT